MGVAAVVGVAALGDAVEAGVRSHSREILGADFSVDARRPLPAEVGDAVELWQSARGGRLSDVERTDLVETAAMVARPGEGDGELKSRLAQVRSIVGRWPLYGRIETDPPGGLGKHLWDGSAVVAEELLQALDLRPGDTLLVGNSRVRITAALVREPGRIGVSSLLGPRVYVSSSTFRGTGLGFGFGTRVRHAAYFALPGQASRGQLGALREWIETEVPGGEFLDVDTHYEAQPQGGRTMRRLEGYLGLVALLSLLLGGIGVGHIVSAWIAGRAQPVAVMRCLGLRPREILRLYLGQAALLALLGSTVGAAVGCALPPLVVAAAPDLFPGETDLGLSVGALVRGIGLGVLMALLFSLPPLTALWRVPPARVLRAEAEPLPPNRVVAVLSWCVLVGGVLLAALLQAGRPSHAIAFTAGLIVLTALLVGAARGLMALAARVPRARLGAYLRHGIAALARPGAGTTGAIVALGLGTLVVCTMWIVESRLVETFLAQVPATAPSVFLADVKPDQWDGVETALQEAGAEHVDHVPIVMARIASIDGRPVAELAEEARNEGRGRWGLVREQRLTSRAELTADNVVVAGSLWSDPGVAEVSLEQRFARRLGVGVGSRITFDVHGVPTEFAVTSIRTVKWESISINFFVVAEPGTLESAPSTVLASARVPEANEQALQDRIAREHPNVSVVRVRRMLDQVSSLVLRVAFGVRLLGSFTVIAGLVILAGVVAASAVRRTREAALLKTLGVTRAGVAALLGVEYGLAGALAGAVGAGASLVLTGAFFEFVAELDVALPWIALPAAAVGCGALTAGCGVLANLRAIRVRPAASLR